MSDYYVYVYRLPDGTPVYVGKGANGRDRMHLKIAASINAGTFNGGRRNQWHNWLAKRLREGVEFSIERAAEGLDEAAAFALEVKLIASYGRRNFDEGGTLLNFTDGGDGMTSASATRLANDPEWRAKHGAAMKRLASKTEWREKNLDRLARMAADPELIAKRVAGVKRLTSTPEWREKNVANMIRLATDPELIAKRVAAVKLFTSTPEWREKNLAAAQRRRTSPVPRPKDPGRVAANNKRLAADPEWRAKIKRRSEDPVWIAKNAEAIRRLKANPEIEERRIAALRAAAARKREARETMAAILAEVERRGLVPIFEGDEDEELQGS